jgi:hypothetical protein
MNVMLVNTFTHYVYPRHSNNHKAKLLHSSTLLLLGVFLLIFQVILNFLPVSGVKILGYAANISPSKVIELTNQKRTEAGLAPLQYNAQLEQAAEAKGENMLALDYWAHTAPDGTEPWQFFIDSGYNYRYAGENLARDFSNPESAVEAWMASPSHRDNLLSDRYKDVGIAVVEGDLNGVDTTIIVQLFGTKLVDTTPQLPIAEAQTEVTTPIPTIMPTSTPLPTPTEVTLLAQNSPDQGNLALGTQGETQQANLLQRVLVSPFDTTRGVSLVTITTLLIVMIIDGVVVKRRKIPRLGGKTFAHLAFLGMVLTLILIAKAGDIL